MIKRYIPIFDWGANYKIENLRGDVFAGTTVGIMLIPQGMAYAMLAGLPPIYGLYASMIPLIVYAVFGTSRQLSVGPVAMVAILVASGVGTLAEIGSPAFITYTILLAFMVGIIQFVMGVFRLGFLVNFLSHPVIAGFTSAAAIIIGLSQMKHLLGIDIPRGNVYENLFNIYDNIDATHLPTLFLGLLSIAIMLVIKKLPKNLPGPIIVVLLSIAIVYFGNLAENGVKIVKNIPSGLPSFSFPELDGMIIKNLLPIALTISFVSFIQSIAIAKAIESKHKSYRIIPNQELIGLGLANILGSFFQAFPVTGGFSRTVVNDQAGAKTGLAAIISSMLIIITLLFWTDYFYYLPTAVLAAIIIVAVYGLVDVNEAKYLWKHDRTDFTVFMITALATLLLGIEEGIITGVFISLGMLVYRASYPHIAELGCIPNSKEYRNIKRFDNLETYDDVLIMRFDAELFFANAFSFHNYIMNKIKNKPSIRHIIVESSSIANLDSSAVHMLKNLIQETKNNNCEIYFSDVKGPVRDKLKSYGMLNEANYKQFFVSTEDAVRYIKMNDTHSFVPYISQSSEK